MPSTIWRTRPAHSSEAAWTGAGATPGAHLKRPKEEQRRAVGDKPLTPTPRYASRPHPPRPLHKRRRLARGRRPPASALRFVPRRSTAARGLPRPAHQRKAQKAPSQQAENNGNRARATPPTVRRRKGSHSQTDQMAREQPGPARFVTTSSEVAL